MSLVVTSLPQNTGRGINMKCADNHVVCLDNAASSATLLRGLLVGGLRIDLLLLINRLLLVHGLGLLVLNRSTRRGIDGGGSLLLLVELAKLGLVNRVALVGNAGADEENKIDDGQNPKCSVSGEMPKRDIM